ncbi:hypothetical protein EGM51_17870 [Verrucomicrobia bacterium S94]|nr:hypothetical protein EGM51_17870 [Verrucomicrobia bacterium S94]
MKPLFLPTILLLSLHGLAGEMREWRSRDGSQTLYAQYASVRNNDTVVLLSKELQKYIVPIARLSTEDQDYLFKEESRKALGTNTGKVESAAYRRGEILGPLEAIDGSSFYLYVPKSLADIRSAPLMLYTGPTGGKLLNIRELINGAEVTGWIVAVAVEPDYYNSVDVNRKICDSMVQTLLNTAPVDRRRLYFAGFSAGASVSYYNQNTWKACGLIPMSTYIPQGWSRLHAILSSLPAEAISTAIPVPGHANRSAGKLFIGFTARATKALRPGCCTMPWRCWRPATLKGIPITAARR